MLETLTVPFLVVCKCLEMSAALGSYLHQENRDHPFFFFFFLPFCFGLFLHGRFMFIHILEMKENVI